MSTLVEINVIVVIVVEVWIRVSSVRILDIDIVDLVSVLVRETICVIKSMLVNTLEAVIVIKFLRVSVRVFVAVNDNISI